MDIVSRMRVWTEGWWMGRSSYRWTVDEWTGERMKTDVYSIT